MAVTPATTTPAAAAFRHPTRPGVLLHPVRLLLALHDVLDLVGLVIESTACASGDDRWRACGQQIRRAARELTPP